MSDKPNEMAIVKRTEQTAAVSIPSAQNLRMLAQDFLNSGMFPAVRNVAGAITIIQYGHELGIPPVSALQTMAIVNGKLCMEAKAMQAVFQQHGGNVKVLERSKVRARIELSKPGMEAYVHEYTMDQAKTEKLSGKDNWTKMPETMLYWRAVATGIRLYDPGAIFGLYSKEELADIDTSGDKGRGAARAVATKPTESATMLPTQAETGKTAIVELGGGFFGNEDNPDAVVEGEVVDEQEKDAPVESGDSFFQPVEPESVEPEPTTHEGDGGDVDEKPLFADDAAGGIVAAIKESLKAEGVDECAYKEWLYNYQQGMKPPRHFIGMKFNHPSLSVGNAEDLKWLHSNLKNSVLKFKRRTL